MTAAVRTGLPLEVLLGSVTRRMFASLVYLISNGAARSHAAVGLERHCQTAYHGRLTARFPNLLHGLFNVKLGSPLRRSVSFMGTRSHELKHVNVNGEHRERLPS